MSQGEEEEDEEDEEEEEVAVCITGTDHHPQVGQVIFPDPPAAGAPVGGGGGGDALDVGGEAKGPISLEQVVTQYVSLTPDQVRPRLAIHLLVSLS